MSLRFIEDNEPNNILKDRGEGKELAWVNGLGRRKIRRKNTVWFERDRNTRPVCFCFSLVTALPSTRLLDYRVVFFAFQHGVGNCALRKSVLFSPRDNFVDSQKCDPLPHLSRTWLTSRTLDNFLIEGKRTNHIAHAHCRFPSSTMRQPSSPSPHTGFLLFSYFGNDIFLRDILCSCVNNLFRNDVCYHVVPTTPKQRKWFLTHTNQAYSPPIYLFFFFFGRGVRSRHSGPRFVVTQILLFHATSCKKRIKRRKKQ